MEDKCELCEREGVFLKKQPPSKSNKIKKSKNVRRKRR